MDEPKVREKFVGPHTGKSGEDHGTAIKVIRQGASAVFRNLGLSQGEGLAVLAAVAAAEAERFGLRADLADIFERWVEVLRSEQPISIVADGTA